MNEVNSLPAVLATLAQGLDEVDREMWDHRTCGMNHDINWLGFLSVAVSCIAFAFALTLVPNHGF